MTTTYTLVSWATVIGVGTAGYYYYRHKPDHDRKVPASKLTTKSADKEQPKKLRKARKDEGQKVVAQEKGQKEQQKQKAEYTKVTDDAGQDEEEINNKEFARQFSNVQSSTVQPAKLQDGARQRSVKQGRAQEKPAVVETSSDNGTGADADDDRSSLNSPELGATTVASPVVNGSVSDMLEAPAPAPSTLRITSPTSPAVPKKAKAAPKNEVVETKKQRQNRQKAEEKKKAREEEEVERKKKEEVQRRKAREAEGRAPKDGSKFMAAQGPSLSAWTAGATNGNKVPEVIKAETLDTYTPSAPQENTQSESELAGSDWQKVAANISEEEQMRRAMEDSDSWKTVAKDKRKKKTQQAPLPTKLEFNDESSDYAPPPLIPPTPAGQKWKMTVVSQDADGEYVERETEVQDSEWEVA